MPRRPKQPPPPPEEPASERPKGGRPREAHTDRPSVRIEQATLQAFKRVAIKQHRPLSLEASLALDDYLRRGGAPLPAAVDTSAKRLQLRLSGEALPLLEKRPVADCEALIAGAMVAWVKRHQKTS